MPHVNVKLYPGRSDGQKAQLTEQIVRSVTTILECDASIVSVAFEEIDPDEWNEKVFLPEVEGKKELLTKKLGPTR